MKILNKFKVYNFLNTKISGFSLRLLNFKRPKWSKIQKVLKSRSRKGKRPVNLYFIKPTSRFWGRVKKQYKNDLIAKKV
jgi:hypothetical protein